MREQQQTLKYVNRIRAACGSSKLDNLPAGNIRSSSDCVIARALHEINQSVLVFQEVIQVDDLTFAKIIAEEFGYTSACIGLDNHEEIKMYCVPLPTVMSAFVEQFDEELYPELVLA